MHEFEKKLIKKFKNKKICIVGFGKEGLSTFNILRKIFPNKNIGIADLKKKLTDKKNLTLHLGKNYLASLSNYDVIFRSPGIPATKIVNRTNPKAIVISQTKLFFDLCPAEIIGVTGTKGKSTTTSLIYHVLKTKFDSHLVGNIGFPPLDHLKYIKPDSKVVFELSSHQLSDIQQSPHIAVFLNLFSEHLDYYSSFNEYAKAKTNITNFQTKNDYFIYNSEDSGVKKIAQKSKANKISFSKKDSIISIKNTNLLGEFNQTNLMPSVIIGRLYKISDEKIIAAIKAFKPLSCRLEKLGTYSGITFINDTLATVPQATIKAINSLKKEIGSLIVGGFDRGVNQEKLATSIINSNIPTIILMPDTGKKIKKLVERKTDKNIKVIIADSMEIAVRKAFQNTQVGKICLLSPGAASFNMFKDYKDKANQFLNLIQKFSYAKKKTTG